MKPSFVILAVASVLALSACSNPDRFASSDAVGSGPLGVGQLGSPSDPTSIAYFQQTVGDTVYFAVDQSGLSSDAMATLAGQAEWLRGNTQTLIVEGHADERGTREYNLALGARRAAAVQDYLVAEGIDPSRLRTVSYGKERPVEVCSTESCFSINRRAVSMIASGAGF